MSIGSAGLTTWRFTMDESQYSGRLEQQVVILQEAVYFQRKVAPHESEVLRHGSQKCQLGVPKGARF